MLKGLKYSAMGILTISILVYVSQVVKLVSLGLPSIVQQATKLFGNFFPEYEKYILDFIQASENLKVYLVAGLVGVIVTYFILISVLTFLNLVLISKQQKNGITLGKMLLVIIFDFIGMYLLIFSTAAGLLNNVSMIANSSNILGLLFVLHLLYALAVSIVYVKGNYREDHFKQQLRSIYKFSLTTIIVVLILFFINKVIAVIVINALVDAGLHAIDVSTFVTSTLLASIDFTKPVSDFLPPAIVAIATNFNLPINMSLNDFGIDQKSVESIVSVSLYQPINDSIFKFLNGITNSFIFKGFGLKLFGLVASVSLLVLNLIKIKLPLVKHVALVAIDVVIIGLVIFYFNSGVLITLTLIVFGVDVYRLFKAYKEEHLKTVS